MRDWWNSQSPRERMLIISAMVITLVILGYQFVFQPLVKAKAEAVKSWQVQSLETAQTLDGIARLKAAQTNAASQDQTATGNVSLELMLSQTTGELGLSIVRLQPVGDQEIRVSFVNAEPRLLHRWMHEMERDNKALITGLDLRNRPESLGLSGNVTLKRGNS